MVKMNNEYLVLNLTIFCLLIVLNIFVTIKLFFSSRKLGLDVEMPWWTGAQIRFFKTLSKKKEDNEFKSLRPLFYLNIGLSILVIIWFLITIFIHFPLRRFIQLFT